MIILKIFLVLAAFGLVNILILMFVSPLIFKLSETNRLRKWWEKHIIMEEPDVN
jgi:hypothetical protein